MNLSEYMSGKCLRKYNSMGVGVKKCHPPKVFFSVIALMDFLKKIELIFILASRFYCNKLNFACGKNT